MDAPSQNSSPNSSNSIQKNGLLLSYELKKAKFSINEKVAIKFSVENQAGTEFTEKIVYKLSYITNKNTYLITAGSGGLKKNLTVGGTIKFSPTYPPGLSFTFLLELFYLQKPLVSYETADCELELTDFEKRVKLLKVEVPSTAVFPNNPLVFWATFQVGTLPVGAKFHLIAQLKLKDQKLVETKHPLPFTEFPLTAPFKLPFVVNGTEFEGKKVPLILEVTIFHAENPEPFIRKSIVVNGIGQVKGFSFGHVGFKHQMKLGEVGYLMVDVNNKTDQRVNGKTHVSFYSPILLTLPGYERKFQLQRQEKDSVVEDLPVPDVLASSYFWVISKTALSFKPAGLSVMLEGSSERNFVPVKQPQFHIKIAAPVDNVAYFNEVIGVGIDVRVESEQKWKSLECEIVQNYGNILKTPVYRFKIKDYSHQFTQFHWKVPAKFGSCTLDARILVNGRPVVEKNLSKKEIMVNLFPKPKEV